MTQSREHLTDDLIARFLRTRSTDAELGMLDEIMQTVEVTPQDRPWLGLWPMPLSRRTLLLVAITLLLAAMGAIAFGAAILNPDRISAQRMTVIGHVIDAVNDRDVGSLRSAFAADGIVEYPGIDARAGREGKVFMSDDLLHEDAELWMGRVDRWGLEARLGSCRTHRESTISCSVLTGWHVLQLEIGEEWIFEFDGVSVARLQMTRVDPDPTNRVLPLGLVDIERWAAWLRVTHPEQADRLLPTGPDVFGHWYFRFGLDASPDEIGESIREYILVAPEQSNVINQVIDATNRRDADAFIDAFLAVGVFQPGGDFRDSSSLFANSLPVADASLVEAWMAINDAWRFEAEVISCTRAIGADIVYGYGEGQGDPMVVRCDVATRWHTLSMEITQTWVYEFHGTGLGHWAYELSDLNPDGRLLPLGYDELYAWEAWLEANRPASATRLLNPRGGQQPGDCDGCQAWWDSLAPGDPARTAQLAPLLTGVEHDWSIQGHDFSPWGLIPYDPAYADEIEGSIQEYLRTR